MGEQRKLSVGRCGICGIRILDEGIGRLVFDTSFVMHAYVVGSWVMCAFMVRVCVMHASVMRAFEV